MLLTNLRWAEMDGSGDYVASHDFFDVGGLESDLLIAADIDRDGDLDAVSAAQQDLNGFHGMVGWYENEGAGTSWTFHLVLSRPSEFPRSLDAADVDRDGDTDLLLAWTTITGPHDFGTLFWLENLGGGLSWIEREIESGDNPRNLMAGDLDEDGDLDFFGAFDLFATPGRIALYQNRGGQAALPTTAVAQGVVGDGEVHDLFAVELHHRGIPVDNDAELATIELRFTDPAGTPLTYFELTNLIESFSLFLDDGSGAFEETVDTPVPLVTWNGPVDGVVSWLLPDGHADLQVAPGQSKTYFLVVELTANASSRSPSAFRATHLVTASSTAEDATHDVKLVLEDPADVATDVVDTALSTASCHAPCDMDLLNRTVAGTLVCEAGTELRAGDGVVVAVGGDLTLRGGQSVVLGSGFRVDGGTLAVEVDPGLQP